MSTSKKFVHYWLPVCLLCTGIFIQSSFAVPDIGPDWLLWEWLPLDKVAHGMIYAVLSALICRAFATLPPWQDRKVLLTVTGILLATLFGLSDEWHQSFVVARSADPSDFGADALGSILGALLFLGQTNHASNRNSHHDPNHLP